MTNCASVLGRILMPLLAVMLAVMLAPAAPAIACDPALADIRTGDVTVRFEVEIADDAEERALGLMHRESLPQFSGMLFVYDVPQPVGFWMRNTLIPLDILFMDRTGTVLRVARNAVPLSEENIPGGPNIQFVLEVNGGLTEMLGIGPGAELRHPAIDGVAAAWPCENS